MSVARSMVSAGLQVLWLLAAALGLPATNAAAGTACNTASRSVERLTDGVIVTPTSGAAKRVRLRVVSDRVIRVTAFPTSDTALPPSLMAVRDGGQTRFDLGESPGAVTLRTRDIEARVSLADGRVMFLDRKGRTVLAELPGGRSFRPIDLIDVNERPFYAIRQQFESPPDEAFYGLGQHQNGIVDYKGRDVELAQHNMDIGVPFVVSSRHYGILWDNDSITRFGDPRDWQPLSKGLTLYDAHGRPGALTARYYAGGRLLAERRERDVDYQYIDAGNAYPPGFAQLPHSRVVWEGSIEAPVAGTHKFTLYASDHHKLYVDGRLVIDAWRQNWNPWYRDFGIAMKPGERHRIRIEWNREGGYLALLHRPPLPRQEQSRLSLYSQVARAIDYYFIYGATADQVVSGYRLVTGKAVLLPRWAYGFWQSRDHYETQDQLLGVVEEYRRRGIPLDNIVQDWRYWKDDSWGSHAFDRTRYPDPQAMVDRVHALHAHIMISVWAKFYPTTAHFRELDAKGYIYSRNLARQVKDWVGPGYLSSFYDPYAPEARRIYWRQIDETLGKLGIDAWWLDSDEPDIESNISIPERKLRMGPTALGPGAEFFNSYSLPHAQGVYEGSRASRPGKRVFILSRSGFAGLQRYAAATWSGDVAPRWSDLRDQIPAGIGISISGLPNWTTDIGGYQPEERYLDPSPDDLREWRELNTRWFEFGAFQPIFRSHGQKPYREIFNLAPAGSDMYDTLVYYDKLRYRLLPYIYTVAADTYFRDYTIMRALVMDFPRDARVRDIADEYLFGPSLLVAPVYRYGARDREVYLPAGAEWYDFYSGAVHPGGERISASAPLDRIPLFVRAGAIVPMGPEIQYSSQEPDAPLTLQVYTGADGAFSLYEDSGVDYGYERGEYSRIPISYSQARGALTIGTRQGSYPGMPTSRTFLVRWIAPGVAPARVLGREAPQRVEYSGRAVVVARPSTADGPE